MRCTPSSARSLGMKPRCPQIRSIGMVRDNSSYAPLVADLTIFVSTNPACANEAFNVVKGDHFCWKYMWPRAAAYFGAKASSDQNFEKPFPTPGVPQLELSFA